MQTCNDALIMVTCHGLSHLALDLTGHSSLSGSSRKNFLDLDYVELVKELALGRDQGDAPSCAKTTHKSCATLFMSDSSFWECGSGLCALPCCADAMSQ